MNYQHDHGEIVLWLVEFASNNLCHWNNDRFSFFANYKLQLKFNTSSIGNYFSNVFDSNKLVHID